MELYLQFGHGMMDHSRALIDAWRGGTVILSPRDLSSEQLPRLANDITKKVGGCTLLDPQFYLPHADHKRLVSHSYWPSQYDTAGFWGGAHIGRLVGDLLTLNAQLHCDAAILPSLFADRIDADWIARQKAVIDAARGQTAGALYATVAIGVDAVRSDEAIDAILDAANDWDVDGVYLVCEHPAGDYLVGDPIWIANVHDLAAGFRLMSKVVVVGYCNHQLLTLSCVSANAIASGTWMNVRSFPPEKFRTQYDEEIKQRATWYYCPQALSEYKIPYLDVAKRQGVLGLMKAADDLQSSHADILFSDAQPTAVGWAEPSAFRHYLQCLWSQARIARRESFDATIDAVEHQLDAAQELLTRLQRVGVRGLLRDFKDPLEATRSALSLVRSSRGPLLRRHWVAL